ncbi:MAG: deoxyribose-phosphate aldolase, partial [Vagococcus sp.]
MNLAKYVDHTLLKPEATKEQIKVLCEEASQHDFASVCVNPYWVSYASDLLSDSDVKVCTVIGFPLGATSTATKFFEAKNAIDNGANEIDMVINVGELKSKNYDAVEADIAAVVKASHPEAIVKVIIETCLLTKEEI